VVVRDRLVCGLSDKEEWVVEGRLGTDFVGRAEEYNCDGGEGRGMSWWCGIMIIGCERDGGRVLLADGDVV